MHIIKMKIVLGTNNIASSKAILKKDGGRLRKTYSLFTI
jgi:hypothetical protein